MQLDRPDAWYSIKFPSKNSARPRIPRFFLMAVPRLSIPFSTWSQMHNKSLLNLKVRLACGSAILTLLVVGAMSYRGTVVYKESDLWVRHTHEVLERLGNL